MLSTVKPTVSEVALPGMSRTPKVAVCGPSGTLRLSHGTFSRPGVVPTATLSMATAEVSRVAASSTSIPSERSPCTDEPSAGRVATTCGGVRSSRSRP